MDVCSVLFLSCLYIYVWAYLQMQVPLRECRSIRSGVYGPPHYCAPIVCVPAVIEVLASCVVALQTKNQKSFWQKWFWKTNIWLQKESVQTNGVNFKSRAGGEVKIFGFYDNKQTKQTNKQTCRRMSGLSYICLLPMQPHVPKENRLSRCTTPTHLLPCFLFAYLFRLFLLNMHRLGLFLLVGWSV